MSRRRHLWGKAANFLRRLFGGEAGAGLLLIAVALAAMVAANSGLATTYHDIFHHDLERSPIPRLPSLHAWINDGLMAIFFFVVGLEIKREVVDGHLKTWAQRTLPAVAAAAGMAVPAVVYLLIAESGPVTRGWAIPAATDIAFAVGIIALVGKRLPPSLRLFLLTVAIIDDLGAVAIIALAYTADIHLGWLVASAAILAVMIGMNRFGVRNGPPYLPLAFILWFCVLHSGVHATVAGVLAAFTIPMRLDSHHDCPLLRLEHALTPWSAYLIVPLFGFANAGVALSGEGGVSVIGTLPLAVAAGLFFGKQAGILGAIAIARVTGLASPPVGASWLHLWGLAMLCGIGFTMSLFIAGLAFPAHPELVEEAKLGILAGSIASALCGYVVLRLTPARQ